MTVTFTKPWEAGSFAGGYIGVYLGIGERVVDALILDAVEEAAKDVTGAGLTGAMDGLEAAGTLFSCVGEVVGGARATVSATKVDAPGAANVGGAGTRETTAGTDEAAGTAGIDAGTIEAGMDIATDGKITT